MERLTKISFPAIWTGKKFPCFSKDIVPSDKCELEFCFEAYECDFIRTRECPYLRVIDRLAAYEDTGLTPEDINEFLHKSYGPLHKKLGQWIAAEKDGRLAILPTNAPLTLEELREMDGEPVWISKMNGSGGAWMLVDAGYELCREAHGEMAVFENCGKTWLAYRHRLEEDRHGMD